MPLSTFCAITPAIAEPANASPQTSVSVRLTCLNSGRAWTSGGACSRAYCSVNGTNASEPRTTIASTPLEIACE